jgi:extracellular factor (EF) 3-hydroxypalmitic acid methyl ester biosynthesis protein
LITCQGDKYAVAFIKLRNKDLDILIEKALRVSEFEKQFVVLTREMREYLRNVKEKCDRFDVSNTSSRAVPLQMQFIEENKSEIFKFIDNHFNDIWNIVKDLPRDIFNRYRKYYQCILDEYMKTPVEINMRIREKPLGYSGDFIIMNYIYDYHKGSYLGNTTYEKIINHYTCNVPVSCSNIMRKEFVKEQILETLRNVKNPKILSVGCGPARELVEILRENGDKYSFSFVCLDFEKKALEYVRNELEHIKFDRNRCKIDFIHADIRDLIRNKEVKSNISGCDLLYISGVFDYLSDRICSKIINDLLRLVNNNGSLVTCNISLGNDGHRAYYELLGEWEMNHRNESQVLSWTHGLSEIDESNHQIIKCGNYLILVIRKK